MSDLFQTLLTQVEQLHDCASQSADHLADFTRRLELILSQVHKNIPIRDTAFAEEFAAFCTSFRSQMDQFITIWQQLRQDVRQQLTAKIYPSSLQAKSFAMHTKTLSRSSDELTTTYDMFNARYKSYTLSKLPVWVLTSCCEDLNHLVGKILFLSRELTKYYSKI